MKLKIHKLGIRIALELTYLNLIDKSNHTTKASRSNFLLPHLHKSTKFVLFFFHSPISRVCRKDIKSNGHILEPKTYMDKEDKQL